MTKRKVPLSAPAAFTIATLAAIIGLSSYNTLALSVVGNHVHTNFASFRRISKTSCFKTITIIHNGSTPTYLSMSSNDEEGPSNQQTPTPLCDLQTFLRMSNLVESGGEAKNVIQNSKCLLNGTIETRRSKKLFHGDKVSYFAKNAVDLDVATEVKKRGYVYKPKVKKVKPLAKVDAEGNVEFGGRFRSEEWRAERKLKKSKAERKTRNKDGSKD
ncbi:hypothetical protein ACHAXR_001808 [Thalassiosira sp. AJA248-18]